MDYIKRDLQIVPESQTSSGVNHGPVNNTAGATPSQVYTQSPLIIAYLTYIARH